MERGVVAGAFWDMKIPHVGLTVSRMYKVGIFQMHKEL
jgi:hypothetical protein